MVFISHFHEDHYLGLVSFFHEVYQHSSQDIYLIIPQNLFPFLHQSIVSNSRVKVIFNTHLMAHHD